MSASQLQALSSKLREYDPNFKLTPVGKMYLCTATYKEKVFKHASLRDWDAINQVIQRIKEFANE